MNKKQKIAVYPGSFNPVHPGHLWTIAQAAEVFDKVIVLIAENPGKTYSVFALKRKEWILNLFHGSEIMKQGKLEVDITGTGLVEYCEEKGIDTVIRGIRNGQDFEYETAQYEYNKLLVKNPNTWLKYVFFPAIYNTDHISSSSIRQFVKFCDVKQLTELYVRSAWFFGVDQQRAGAVKEIWRTYHDA